MTADVTSMTLLAVTQSIPIYTALMPSVSDVRKSRGDTATREDVHKAAMTGGILVVGVGLVASVFAKSPVPGMAALMSAVVFTVVYQVLLESQPKEATA